MAIFSLLLNFEMVGFNRNFELQTGKKLGKKYTKFSLWILKDKK